MGATSRSTRSRASGSTTPTHVWLVMDDGRVSQPKYLSPMEGANAVAVGRPMQLTARLGDRTRRNPKPASDPVPLTVCSVPNPDNLKVVPQSAAVFEGDDGWTNAKIPVSLTAASDLPVRVEWSTHEELTDATAGTDYVAPSRGTVEFAPGETTHEVPVRIRGDALEEANEQLIVLFTNATNAELGGLYGVGRVVIVDDD